MLHEVPRMTDSDEASISVTEEADVVLAGRQTKTILADLAFEDSAVEEIVLVVHELASNIVDHAGEGSISIVPRPDGDRCGIEIRTHDSGPGIVDVNQAVVDGYSSTGSLGGGLGAVNRMMDDVVINSSGTDGTGVEIVATRWSGAETPEQGQLPIDVGAATRAMPGYDQNGDAFLIEHETGRTLVGVIDGLGHGEAAHRASREAQQYVRSHTAESLKNIFAGVEGACRDTRGVVMLLARFEWEAGTVTLGSVGNITLRLCHAKESRHLVAERGVLGGNASSPMIREWDWDPDAVMVLHSDGLTSRWDCDEFALRDEGSATAVARELLRSLSKADDDATVLVVKGGRSMTDDHHDTAGMTEEELRSELRRTRSRLRALESELAETNEGMVALTLELENARERYQTIFEESTDGILLIHPEKNSIREANPQACDLLGYDHDTLVTLSPADIFPDENDRVHTFAEAVVHGWADGFTCRTNDGRKIDVDISASMITLDGESLLLASLRDITQRKRREQRLQVLSRIFRHNLRNDGNVIQGHADILCDALSDSDLEASARQIQKTIDEILRLSSKVRRVQDVLDRTQVERTPIGELLSPHHNWVEKTYPAAMIEVNIPDQEVLVGRRLGVAIQEAIENAAKHAGMEPTIQVAVAVNEERELVWVEIHDDGPGMPEQELQVLDSGGETPLAHGSGIGLWLIYWVIDSLGGEVTVESDDPDGTVVTIEVPLETARTNIERGTPDYASNVQ